ncbi:family 78 glycoside hydrolase catalytic domain [Kribbella sp. NPDC051137]|uniref:family 78 glycoside hydrolase catalytic domain n=1 Tax=Kribbella sp. NPDC051137 TaxID=3155045 RepID=UPI002F4C72C3
MDDDAKAPDRRTGWMTSAAWQQDPDGPLPVLGTAIEVTGEPRDAVLRVAGLGVFVAAVNGQVVSDPLEPGYTDYALRAEFCTYDVTARLVPGPNVITIELGPGCYRSRKTEDRWTKIETTYGELAACATLDWTDDTGPQELGPWHATTGAVRTANWVGGEDYDAHHEPDLQTMASWPAAVPAKTPVELRLSAKTIPPIREVERLTARSVTTVRPGVHVVDFGVNFAGWVELDLPPNAEVRLRPAELLEPSGEINPVTQGWGPVFHTVTTADAPLTWHPTFCYNGLRYLEISGVPTAPDARGLVLAAVADSAGTFTSSDAKVTELHRIIRRAITSNMYSMFTDCPQREKLGYLEQLHLVYPILRWNYDVRELLANTLRIVREAQEPSGHIALYVPEWDPFPDPWRGDVNFSLVCVFLPWQLYRTYGDRDVLTANHDTAVRYVEYLLASREDGLVTYGLGDWNGRDFRYVPFVATATLARALGVLADTAWVLGQDGRRWDDVRAAVVGDVRRRFVTAEVGSESVAELAVAIHSGVLTGAEEAAAVDRLERRIVADGYYLDVGEIAMASLVEVLATYDRHETLYQLTQVDERPGYGYMLRHGATSLTETWDGPTFGFSQNHFMNGAIDDWFFSHVAGLRQAAGDIGFHRVVIRPRPCGGLTSAAAAYRTGHGELRSAWTVEDGGFDLEVVVPAETTAVVELPDGTTYDVGPGRHRFAG